MRSLHLALMAFCQLLLASVILHSIVTSASPVVQQISIVSSKKGEAKTLQEMPLLKREIVAEPAKATIQAKSAAESPIKQQAPVKQQHDVESKVVPVEAPIPVPVSVAPSQPTQKQVAAPIQVPIQAPIPVVKEPVSGSIHVEQVQSVVQARSKPVESPPVQQSPIKVESNSEAAVAQPKETSAKLIGEQPVMRPDLRYGLLLRYLPDAVAGETDPVVRIAEAANRDSQQRAESTLTNKIEQQQQQQPQQPLQAVQQAIASPAKQEVVRAASESQPILGKSVPVNAEITSGQPVVKGGLGPLHLLAATLCNYQPDKPTADDTLNSLYSQRAAVRKSLFEFMSLKFTSLEKLSSQLNSGLEVVPPKPADPSSQSVSPSHGWPVVGKCTAHDLRLMAEAAWCEYEPTKRQPAIGVSSVDIGADQAAARITSNRHRGNRKRSVETQQQRQSPVVVLSTSSASGADQSSVISKILHVNDVKDAPVVEGNMNLTQQLLELASMTAQQQPSSSVECRRKALRLTKSLFNHLAEDQKGVSESWPELYVQLEADDCARKRMIDVVKTLSAFRGESSPAIRRDNVEFAFAMDDLRAKVLEKEVNVPLSVDKQFIEVEQFLQQSVKLMLANIDPERAKLTSMRYRSLMAGPSASADDQCIELHQRLLAKNYPTDCNPNQFGQLPDVLRMAASSLELWSIEKELSKRSSKITDYLLSPSVSATVQCKRDVEACIANLVAS